MSEQEIPLSKRDQLALAIARGKSVVMWARENNVPKRTAYRWATNPKVRRVVEARRRHVFDRTIRQMARRANWASHQLAMLAKGAESESVQFRAVRSICSDAVAVSKSSDLDYRMAEIEDALRDRAGDTGVPG